MFNCGGFNKIPFNTSRVTDEFSDCTVHAWETVESILGSANILNSAFRANERMLGSVEWGMVLLDSIDVSERIILGKLEFTVLLNQQISAGDSMHMNAYLGKNMYVFSNPSDQIHGDVYIGKNIYACSLPKEVLQGQAHIGKNIFNILAAQDNIHNFIRMALRRYQTFFIEATIPPGAEIRIDSNNFTVFLLQGGQTSNLRGRFTGDWIHFDRDTYRLYIENEGMQMLTGDVMYNDRWL